MSRKGKIINDINDSNFGNQIKVFDKDKQEKSLDINSISISEQIMNNNNEDKLIKMKDSLNKEEFSENIEQIESIMKKSKEKAPGNKTVKFKNSNKIRYNYTLSNANTISDLIQPTEKIFKKKKNKKVKRLKTINSDMNLPIVEENNKLTIRQKLSQFFESNKRLFYLRIIVISLTTLSYIYYVICTYKTDLFKSLNYIDFFICFAVIIEHMINIILSHHIFKYLISIESLINFIIEIPPFFSLLSDDNLGNLYRFINITRVLRLAKCYILMELLHHGEKNVNNQILNIIISILLIIFIFSGIVQIFDLENVLDELKISYIPEKHHFLNLRKNYHHYIYFVVVSLTTVGYGDITPLSVSSQVTIVFFVFVILIVIPDKTDELITLSTAQTIYERKKYISIPDVPFLVLLGNITFDSLKSFCEEYFHDDHGQFYRHIVILRNKAPDKELELFLNEKDNKKFIFYLQGDPMKDENLIRADLLNAKSCVIFCDKNSNDLLCEDQKEILLSLYIKKYYYVTMLEKINPKIEYSTLINPKNLLKANNFKIFLQLNKTGSSIFYYGALQNHYKKYLAKDQLLIIEALKMNLLSKSCVTPGIIALLYNLMISAPTRKISSKNEPEWSREYTEGTQYEIYKFTAEDELLNFNFSQLAIDIYNKFHSLLFALEINYKGHSLIKLNPGNKDTIKNIIEKNLFKKDKKINLDDNKSTNNLIRNYTNDDGDNDFSIMDEENSVAEKLRKELKIRNYVKINFYLISKDKEIIGELQKLDHTKIGKEALKSRFRKNVNKVKLLNSLLRAEENKFSESSDKDKIKKMKLRKIKTLKKNKTLLSEDGEFSESSSNNEEINTKEIISKIFDNFNKSEQQEQIINNYYTIEGFDKKYLANEIKLKSIKGRRDISEHIIICGMHPDLIHFILPLRAKYLTEKMLKWIIILSPYLPQEIYDVLKIFPKIIYIQGEPFDSEDLFKCNIMSAEIAVILCNNMKSKIEDQILDSSTIFIYNTIRKINHSIKIITELLVTRNIEFLLSSKYLKNLNLNNNNTYSNINSTNLGNNKNSISSPNYEVTPVFATGEIYLPSLGDKILAQMFFNANLLTIIQLILEGEKKIMNKKEKKMNDMFNLTGSNLFMIPCEIKNESFGEMFKRMLVKNGILCIGLYRKNMIDNFYYVYTNPKKTTLIRETDYVFVFAVTENIEDYFEKNEFNINNENESNNNEYMNFNNNLEENFEQGKTSIFQTLQNSIKEQNALLSNNNDLINNNFNNNNEQIIQEQNIDNNIINDHSISDNNLNNINNEHINFTKNYKEIDDLQIQVDKTKEKLMQFNSKFNMFDDELNSYIKSKLTNELFVNLNKLK